MNVWAIILGSAVGGLSRYGVGTVVHRLVGDAFPFGTLTVNAIGCLIVGLLSSAGGARFNLSYEAKLLLVTGFCGGFTTFSAFILESEGLFRSGALGLAAAYIALTLSLGFAAFALGAMLGRLA